VTAAMHLISTASCRNAVWQPLRTSLVVITLLWLAGCRGVPERSAQQGSWLSERQQYFAAQPDWSSRGRLAISDGYKGLSVNFDLLHHQRGYELVMRTTGGRWTLQVRPGLATLEGTRIGRMVDTDPEPLVSAALEWPVPVTLLLDWLRALPGTATDTDAAAGSGVRMQMAADGSLKRLQHQGWTVDYTSYELVTDSASGTATAVLMPTRLEASSGNYRIRTLISQWQL